MTYFVLQVLLHLCQPTDLLSMQYNTIRWTIILTCAQKLTSSQLNLPHGTKQKRVMRKLKQKTEMLRRNGPVIKFVESVVRLEGSLWWERSVYSSSVRRTPIANQLTRV